MPRGDGTGPMGMGRLLGRKLGFCARFHVPGFMSTGFDRFAGLRKNRRGGRIFLLAAGLLSGCGYLAYRHISKGKIRK